MGLRTASYYFIVRRHMWSGNISTRRERVKSSTDEQFVAPCRVLARSHAAGRQARPSNMHHDVGVLLPPEIETDERVLIAQVEEAIRQRRIGPDNAVQDLRACDRTKRLW